MNDTKSFLRFICMVAVLSSFILTSTTTVFAGSNGQQIGIFACSATRVVVQGNNQKGKSATYTVDNPGCGRYYVKGWWWIGPVTLTAYYNISTSHGSEPEQWMTVNIPLSQTDSDWYFVNFPTPTARQLILWRAQTWVNDHIPYDRDSYHDGYRQDCSGYVSFAWRLPKSYSGDAWNNFATRISFNDLQPGDALDNPLPGNAGHMLIFIGWVNQSAGTFNAYEENSYYGGAHQTNNITLDKAGKLSIPGYTYPGNYIAIRKNGL
jgi:hypothetical protein